MERDNIFLEFIINSESDYQWDPLRLYINIYGWLGTGSVINLSHCKTNWKKNWPQKHLAYLWLWAVKYRKIITFTERRKRLDRNQPEHWGIFWQLKK